MSAPRAYCLHVANQETLSKFQYMYKEHNYVAIVYSSVNSDRFYQHLLIKYSQIFRKVCLYK